MSNNPVYGFTSTPSGTAPTGALATNATAGIAYVGQSGSWVPLLTTTAGGTVTLAGDVTGSSSANTAVALTGTASTVAMHAANLQWDRGVAFNLLQQTQTGNVPAQEFVLTLQTPSATATLTNRNSPNGSFVIPQPTSGGSYGTWTFYHNTQASLAISDSAATLGVTTLAFKQTLSGASVTFEAKTAGVANTLTVRGQRSLDNVGGTVRVSSGLGGGGNTSGDVVLAVWNTDALAVLANSGSPILHTYVNSFRWDETCTTPAIFQAQRTSDAACHDLLIQSQAPYASATGSNALPGNIIYNIPAPVPGSDPEGHHQFKVSSDEIFKIERGSLTTHAGIVFADDFIVLAGQTIGAERAATGVAGTAMTFEGQQAGAGVAVDGGSIYLIGGTASGTGVHGEVGLFSGGGGCGVRVIAKDASHSWVALATGGGFSIADLPANMTNAVFVGEYAGVPASAPANGFVMASVNGQPYFLTEDDRNIGFDLENLGGTFGSPPGLGTFHGWVKFGLTSVSCVIPVWRFA